MSKSHDEMPSCEGIFQTGTEVHERNIRSFETACSLSVHDNSVSADVLLSEAAFPAKTVSSGDLLRIHYHLENEEPSSRLAGLQTEIYRRQNGSTYVFFARFASHDQLSRLSSFQISIPKSLADTLRLSKGATVKISKADGSAFRASHVELVFRDQYLARADMWRLINKELAGKCVYQGQKIEFMGTIKAVIRNIFVDGAKLNSAVFHASTKPIFRSESARYVLFIQMSREMWEFDTTGTGEIMFDKVVSGFLPELFRRWKQMQVRHLVSIVLFTRLAYDNRPSPKSLTGPDKDVERSKADDAQFKDYYRVVATDMASIDSANILERLKREFQTFLPDVMTRAPKLGDYVPLGSEGLQAASAELPDSIVSGRPTVASQGNILEAINLASSQFSSDYIDRDLVRTGVSVVVISPGSGLFEVDYKLLIHTTENLTANGVGIDLVCLSRMPLHSVPLFKYNQPDHGKSNNETASRSLDSTPTRSYSNTMDFGAPASASPSIDISSRPKRGWRYGIPHWVDISYWTTVLSDPNFETATRPHLPNPLSGTALQTHKEFKSRIRMYELQMMGVTEDASSTTSIPLLRLSSHNEPRLVKEPNDSAMKWPMNHTGMASTPIDAGKTENDADDESIEHWMETYDEHAFRHQSHAKQYKNERTLMLGKAGQLGRSSKVKDHRGAGKTKFLAASTLSQSLEVKDVSFPSKGQSRVGNQPSLISSARKPARHPNAASSRISYSPGGLRITQSSAKAEVTAINSTSAHGIPKEAKTNDQPQNVSQGDFSDANIRPTDDAHQHKKAEGKDSTTGSLSDGSREAESATESEQDLSQPIPIQNETMHRTKGLRRRDSSEETSHEILDRVAILKDVRGRKLSNPSKKTSLLLGPELPTLSPTTTLAPWVTVLNPCNPTRALALHGNRLGRWHHIFPRPLKASQIKWKSLCSPAAVPLTTEDFPTPEELAEEYRERSYIVPLPPEDTKASDQRRSLANELLAFRLSRGFQIVVGERVAHTMNKNSFMTIDIFNEHVLDHEDSTLYMSRGSTVHRLRKTKPDRLEITVFSRHHTFLHQDSDIHYTPRIRSMLADEYENQAIPTAFHHEDFDWDYIDNFVTGHERPDNKRYVEALRPWRARFVLIPMGPPAESRRTSKSKGLTEEENRLEGIKKLTQLWQKCRYIQPEDRQYTKISKLKEDANPLDVQYFTKNPSAVVREELEHAIGDDQPTAPVQLLPEAELWQRSGLNTKRLADKLQSAKGVRIVDRRWHWKLHHYCLIGSELTSWLLENFKDVNSRDEARDLGNELMKDGLFRHVEKRHDFRDGHYFYQIADDYRTARPESRSFFGWAKSSIPQTPVKESAAHTVAASISKPSAANELGDPEGTSLSEKQRPNVALGRSLVYNLTHSRPKISYREELMNLHYDRLHNPDSCYHIRIEWMNTTPKLIQDAVNHWAMIVEAYGLRLVEVPMGEASSITSIHPFRAPYLITLARQPPLSVPSSYFDVQDPLTQKHSVVDRFYQEAILRRFNFVLDFEAATDFPSNVDVKYSWGKPDYRYPQYIHRSGLLIAQINDDGNLLILANRLYNNKSASARTKPPDQLSDHQAERSPISQRTNPLRSGDGLTQRASAKVSPSPSPATRAARDVPSNSTPASRHRWTHTNSLKTNNNFSTAASEVDPEKLTREIQEFCGSVEALDEFYTEQQSKATTPNSAPFVSGHEMPRRGPETPSYEDNIPELTLPGSWSEKHGMFGNGRGTTASGEAKRAASRSPKSGASERKSTVEMSPLSGPHIK